jgi:hypothetical protein
LLAPCTATCLPRPPRPSVGRAVPLGPSRGHAPGPALSTARPLARGSASLWAVRSSGAWPPSRPGRRAQRALTDQEPLVQAPMRGTNAVVERGGWRWQAATSSLACPHHLGRSPWRSHAVASLALPRGGRAPCPRAWSAGPMAAATRAPLCGSAPASRGSRRRKAPGLARPGSARPRGPPSPPHRLAAVGPHPCPGSSPKFSVKSRSGRGTAPWVSFPGDGYGL